jgi:hypothetical protein
MVMTTVFLILSRREMEIFVTLRLQWLAEPRPQFYAARLITYLHRPAPLGAGGGAVARPTAEEMTAVLAPILGSGLAQVLAVPRHPFWPRKVSQGLGKLESRAKKGVHTIKKIEHKLEHMLERAGTWGIRHAEKRAVHTGLMGEIKMMWLGEDTESSYILIFNSRQVGLGGGGQGGSRGAGGREV